MEQRALTRRLNFETKDNTTANLQRDSKLGKICTRRCIYMANKWDIEYFQEEKMKKKKRKKQAQNRDPRRGSDWRYTSLPEPGP